MFFGKGKLTSGVVRGHVFLSTTLNEFIVFVIASTSFLFFWIRVRTIEFSAWFAQLSLCAFRCRVLQCVGCIKLMKVLGVGSPFLFNATVGFGVEWARCEGCPGFGHQQVIFRSELSPDFTSDAETYKK